MQGHGTLSSEILPEESLSCAVYNMIRRDECVYGDCVCVSFFKGPGIRL